MLFIIYVLLIVYPLDFKITLATLNTRKIKKTNIKETKFFFKVVI